MSRLFGGHGRFLFRSYLLLVAGLLAVAVLLQLGFEYLQAEDERQNDPWLIATLELVGRELGSADAKDRERVAAEASQTLGMEVQLLRRDEVAGHSAGLETLIDDDGREWFLYAPAALDALLYVGPIPPADEGWLAPAIPPLFYASIFLLVGLWLRPLLNDLDRITSAARAFAADYRTPLETASETTQLTSLARDLDDMSARISALIQTQKELIAALSHEMRTPLARLRFGLAVVGGKSDADDANRADRIEALNADIKEIDDLIATMLSYARLDHPDLDMHWQAVPLVPWLTQVAGKFRISDKPIELCHANAPERLGMDPALMTLAVSNLLSNAMRYAKARVRVAVRGDADGYELRVEDDGPGIPGADRDAVFKAFARLDHSRDRATGGYGLGLAIVARIAALHGGSVRVETSDALGGAALVLAWTDASR